MATMTKNETVLGTEQSIVGVMKAVVIRGFGGPDVLELTEVPLAEPRPRHLLIKVNAAGLNRFDHYIRQGEIAPELPWPHILGADASGEVAAIGAGITGFEIGEAVIPVPGYPLDESEWSIRPAGTAASFTVPGLGRPGTYAQYVEFPADFTVKDETGLPPELVAALPMVLATRSAVGKDRRRRQVGRHGAGPCRRGWRREHAAAGSQGARRKGRDNGAESGRRGLREVDRCRFRDRHEHG